jgi:uncharacterized protein YacL
MKNLSEFTNINDYFPMITAGLIVDMIILVMIVFGYINLKSLNNWYNKFGLSAVLADVLSIVIGIIIARFLYSYLFSEYSLVLFLLIACVVQLTHDVAFASFFNSVPRNMSSILDVFKDYAKEAGIQILLVDALMVVSTILLGSYLATLTMNSMIIIFIVLLYILPYLLYSIHQ